VALATENQAARQDVRSRGTIGLGAQALDPRGALEQDAERVVDQARESSPARRGART
jgi:hypothetical protein